MAEHQHPAPQDPSTPEPAEFWEEFYGGDHPWTGKVNALLASELAERPLTPGTALDLGCGTGGDATWLAAQGWQTTGTDIAEAALVRARAATAEVGVDVTWLRADLETEFPAGSWDLVTASYLHSPTVLGREHVLRLAAGALAPGGTMILLSHQRGPSWKPGGHPGHLPTLAEVVASVDLPGLELVHAEAYELPSVSPEGVEGTKVDTVVRVRRA